MRRTNLLLIIAFLVVGCGTTGIYEPGPIAPPAPPPIPAPPIPVEPPPSTFDQIEVGMSRAEVESVLGAPSEDLPEAPTEENDSVRYDVVTDGGPASWFVIYRDGVVLRVRFVEVGVQR